MPVVTMSGPLVILGYHVLGVFLAGAVVAVSSTIVISGFLSRAASPEVARGLIGGIFVYASALAICVLAALLVPEAPALPWTVSVIVAGLAVLGAPILVVPVPSS